MYRSKLEVVSKDTLKKQGSRAASTYARPPKKSRKLQKICAEKYWCRLSPVSRDSSADAFISLRR